MQYNHGVRARNCFAIARPDRPSVMNMTVYYVFFFFFQAEDGIRDYKVTGVQTCALPICRSKQFLRIGESTMSGGDSRSLVATVKSCSTAGSEPCCSRTCIPESGLFSSLSDRRLSL